MSCRQLSGAWTEWRRVAQGMGAAGVASSLAGGALGPAVYCPACAVVADDSSAADTSSAGAHRRQQASSHLLSASSVAPVYTGLHLVC